MEQSRRKAAILWWFPWPGGPGGGSHVSRPGWIPGSLLKHIRPGVQGLGTAPSLGDASPEVGGHWVAGWGGAPYSSLARECRAPWEDVMTRMKIKSAVPGDSCLPVILKRSALHIWEILLNADLLDGLWSGLISSSLQSIQLPGPSRGAVRTALCKRHFHTLLRALQPAVRLCVPTPGTRRAFCSRIPLRFHVAPWSLTDTNSRNIPEKRQGIKSCFGEGDAASREK